MTYWREAIQEQLEKYTGHVVELSDTRISVTCLNPDSFEVCLQTDGEVYQVSFGGWHELFENEEDALNCFAFGLSEECRLKVVKRGGMECSWTVQLRQGRRWVDDKTTGLVFIPFWQRCCVEYRRNIITRKFSD